MSRRDTHVGQLFVLWLSLAVCESHASVFRLLIGRDDVMPYTRENLNFTDLSDLNARDIVVTYAGENNISKKTMFFDILIFRDRMSRCGTNWGVTVLFLVLRRVWWKLVKTDSRKRGLFLLFFMMLKYVC